MKKFISIFLTTAMILSMLPAISFAEDIAEQENTAESEEVIEKVTQDEQHIGNTVNLGSDEYTLLEGEVYLSKDYGRDEKLADGEITWLVEESGFVYWSKLGEHNTSDIIKYNPATGEKTEVTKLFCPAEAFDVSGDEVYYLYNGEISKVNVLTGEETSMGMFDCDGFYLDDGSIVKINRTILENKNNVEILGLSNQKGTNFTTNSQLSRKLQELFDLLVYSDYPYFTVEGNKSCGNSYCWSCNAANVSQSHPKIKDKGITIERNSWSCNGFARYAFKYIFGVEYGRMYYDGSSWDTASLKRMDRINSKADFTEDRVKEFASKASVGDVIQAWKGTYDDDGDQTDGHSMIFLGYDNQGIYVLHSNWTTSSKYRNIVTVDRLSYNTFTSKYSSGALSIFRYTKSDELYPTHSHSFNKSGKCDCGEYDLGRSVIHNALDTEFEQSFASNPDAHLGTYKRIANGSVDVYKYPNANSKYKIGKIYADEVDVIDVIRNSNWTMNFKLDEGMYVNRNEFLKLYQWDSVLTSSISFNSCNSPIGTHTQGKSFGLRGTITSKYDLTTVTGSIVNNATGKAVIETKDSSGKEYNIQKKKINNDLCFNRLGEGTYYLYYTAIDSHGGTGEWRGPLFSVGKAGTPPVIEEKNANTGKDLIISCDDTQAEIIYTINGGSNKTVKAGEKAIINIRTAGSHTIKAHSRKNGIDSSQIERTYHVKKSLIPTIIDYIGTKLGLLDVNIEIEFGNNMAYAVVSGEGKIHYTTDGSVPTENSARYTAPIPLKNSCTVKAISIEYGCAPSDVVSKEIIIKEPDAPSIALSNTKQKIAQGKTATVSWSPVQYATSYHAYLYYNGKCVQEVKDIKGTTASFKLTEVGDYTIKVKSKNFKGLSVDSNSAVVSSMAPVTVTFVDRIIREGEVTDKIVSQIQQNVIEHYKAEGVPEKDIKPIEGNVISVQKIDYDSKPNLPIWEDRVGFSRQYFDSVAYSSITEDKTIYAYYGVKSYSVEFWNYWRDYSDSNKMVSHQDVLYSFGAKLPSPSEFTPPPGYIFAGWSVDKKSSCYDFTFVEGDMKINTVYTWKNKDLPVILQLVSAKRGNTCQSYEVNLKYIHHKESDTQGRIIVTLYTADNKVVDVAVKDVDLMAQTPGTYYPDTVTVNYPDQVARISAVMVRVEGDMTGGAISQMVSTTNIEMPSDATYWSKWSSWSTTKPDSTPGFNENDIQGTERKIESKEQYSYRNKTYTTSSSSSLSGWTKYDTKITSYAKEQGPVDSDPSGKSRKVRSEKYVKSSNYKTIYHYFRYAKTWSGGYGSTRSTDYPNYYEYTFDYELPRYTGDYGYKWHWGSGSEDWNTVWRCDYIGKPYTTQQWVSDNYATRWYYQEPVYTYYFWKWGSWSSWSDTKVTGDENQTQTLYRYRDKFNSYEGYDPTRDSKNMEETKKTYPISGNITGLNKDYNGKLATILVYKKTNTDPTQEQLEYVDQIKLGANNSYSFVVNPKDEIDYEQTGDYIVTLSVEGCEKLLTVDVIKAPIPQQSVTFLDADGNIMKDANGKDVVVNVDKNGSIDAGTIPIPEKEGHHFVKWDKSLINIDADMTVVPIFAPNTYNVVFVDYENKTADMIEVQYGAPAALPEVANIDGKVFKGWDIENYKFAEDGKIDTAIFTSREETPYYKTTSGNYILTSQYNPEIDEIADETHYYKYFAGDKTLVTESKIVTAKWDTLKYTVQFCDLNGNVIERETQEVEYGEAAELPDPIVEGGVVYPWDTTSDEWWNVTHDMTISPYVYSATNSSAPVSDVATGDYDEFLLVNLEAPENSKIYYSTCLEITGEDAERYVGFSEKNNSVSLLGTEDEGGIEDEILPDEGGEVSDNESMDADMMLQEMISEFAEPIPITYSTVIYAFSVDEDGNISTISSFEYNINEYEPEEEKFVPADDVEQITMPSIEANPGETVEVPLTLKNNPGIKNLSIVLGYDAENLELIDIANGEVFADTEFSSDARVDGSCKLEWLTATENTKDGTLAILTFKAKENAGKFDIVFDDVISSDGEEEEYFAIVGGAIENTGESITLGDVNGDGEVTYADAIILLRYDIGFTTLSDYQKNISDVNGDGEVDFADAIKILRFDAGFINSLK